MVMSVSERSETRSLLRCDDEEEGKKEHLFLDHSFRRSQSLKLSCKLSMTKILCCTLSEWRRDVHALRNTMLFCRCRLRRARAHI